VPRHRVCDFFFFTQRLPQWGGFPFVAATLRGIFRRTPARVDERRDPGGIATVSAHQLQEAVPAAQTQIARKVRQICAP
jgi:hypothetical protein